MEKESIRIKEHFGIDHMICCYSQKGVRRGAAFFYTLAKKDKMEYNGSIKFRQYVHRDSADTIDI